MIPLLATVHLRTSSRRNYRIWLPLFVLWIVLFPFALLLLPLFLIACLITWIQPFRALGIFWEILSSFRGTTVEIEESHTFIHIHIH